MPDPVHPMIPCQKAASVQRPEAGRAAGLFVPVLMLRRSPAAGIFATQAQWEPFSTWLRR